MVSVCIDMMFSGLDFYSRPAAVRKCGIDTVEFWKWSNKDLKKIKESGMKVSVFNLDSANEKLSARLSRGILNEGAVEDFLLALSESIPVYRYLSASAMIVLVGDGEYDAENCYKVLAAAKPVLEREGVNLVVEPLNATDRVGYSMPYAEPIARLLRRVDSPRIKMLYDVYHQSVTGDFSLDFVRDNLDIIGHFHIADAPGRHQPGSGSVDYVGIIREIKKTSYDGFFGLEYRATEPDEKTLGFLKEAGELV